MAVGDRIETRSHALGFREEIDQAARHEDRFFTWFNGGETVEEAFQRGQRDFANYIWHYVGEHLADCHRNDVLEIGHGGGRILAAAAQYFRRAIGVDIHDHNQKVLVELKRRRIDNCELFQLSKPQLPLGDESLDTVYSFIVLQHVERIGIFREYVRESFRVLRPGGIALLYFGRQTVFSELAAPNQWRYRIDCALEKWLLPSYRELPARVNCVNLVVSRQYARRWAETCGFRCLSQFASEKESLKGTPQLGGQIGMLLQKPGR